MGPLFEAGMDGAKRTNMRSMTPDVRCVSPRGGRRTPRSITLFALVASLAACTGAIDGDDPSAPEGPRTAAEREGPPGDPLELGTESPRLLPLGARLARLADVMGAPVEDSIFEPFRDAAISLGDYDHSINVLPDDRWTATRMGVWTRLLIPVCADARFAERYGTAGSLDTLLERAWGRPVDASDVALVEDELVGLEGEAHLRASCIIALSSAEAVLQ